MKINDFLLSTFEGDTNTPPIEYALEITEINRNDNSFICYLAETGQMFTFHYSSDENEQWSGTDENGSNYVLATHEVFTAGSIDPYPQGIAVVTFTNGLRLLCYVNNVDPSIDVIFYYTGTPALSFENNVITKSNWEAFPEGEEVKAIEGFVAGNMLPEPAPTETGKDEKKQYLFVDVYQGDLHGKPAWDILVNTPKYYGAIIKATEGIRYNGGNWFKTNWQTVKDIGGDRYGTTWFRGAYLFLKFNQDGAKQADYYLDTIDAVGGWGEGDIIPIIDVELGNDGKKDPSKRNSNQNASAQQIIDCTTACAEQLRASTGRRVMLYGRGAMRDRGITSRMGCDIVWNPSYTRTMVMNGLEAWTIDDIALWQYCGDGVAGIDEKILPRSIPNFGKVDISVYIDGKRKPTIETLLERLGIGTTLP